MRLKVLKEAKYSSDERGSFEWIIKSFFEQGNDVFGNYFETKEPFLALHKGKQIVGIDIDRRAEIDIFFYPLIGEAYRPDDPTSIQIFQVKQIH